MKYSATSSAHHSIELLWRYQPGRIAWIIVIPLIAAAFVWLTVLCAPFTIDDAFISLRYAENLVRGHGLVYNPGERVEGYTNFLWVMLIGAIRWFGGDSLTSAKVLGAGANIATLLMVGFAVQSWVPRTSSFALLLLAPLLLVTNYGFVLWGVGGLETALFTCLATAGLLLIIRRAREGEQSPKRERPVQTAEASQTGTRDQYSDSSNAVAGKFPWAASVFALAALTRPDGIVLFVGGMLGWISWSLVRPGFASRGETRSPLLQTWRATIAGQWQLWLAEVALFGLVVLAHTLFRYSYYGDWVPNTAYLKMSPETAFSPHWNGLLDWLKSWQFVESHALGPIVGSAAIESDFVKVPLVFIANPVVWFSLGGLWRWRQQPQAWVLGFGIAAWLIYLWGINDDWMPGWRYYVPILPAVACLMIGGVDAALSWANTVRRPLARRAAKIVVFGIAFVPLLTSLDEFRNRMWEVQAISSIVRTYREAAKYLREHTSPAETLVMGDAGAIPYYSGLFTIDYAGLADKHMARVPSRPADIDKGDGIIRHYERMRYDTDYLLSRNPSFVQLTGRFQPDGRFRAHYPEAVLVYQALLQDGCYDLDNPVFYDEATQLILVKRRDAVWKP